MRHPVSQFASFYYFKRYGWGLNNNTRLTFHGSEKEFYENMDDCVRLKRSECLSGKFDENINYVCQDFKNRTFL